MIIELIYPRMCCLYGDKGNTLFLQKCFPDAKFVFTELNDKPYFIDNPVDLVCMYSLSEPNQEKALERLMPLKEECKNAFENSITQFLFLGNSFELLGKYIETEDGRKIDALDVFDIYSVRHAPKRFNSLIRAKMQDMTLIGYTSRFSDTFGITEDIALCKNDVGLGSDAKSNLEGILTKNIIGTYLLGPLLPSNPNFAKWLLKRLGIENPTLPHEDVLYTCYETKLNEYNITDLELN